MFPDLNFAASPLATGCVAVGFKRIQCAAMPMAFEYHQLDYDSLHIINTPAIISFA